MIYRGRVNSGESLEVKFNITVHAISKYSVTNSGPPYFISALED